MRIVLAAVGAAFAAAWAFVTQGKAKDAEIASVRSALAAALAERDAVVRQLAETQSALDAAKAQITRLEEAHRAQIQGYVQAMASKTDPAAVRSDLDRLLAGG